MYGLEQGNQVLRQIQKETSMDRVERLLDDTAEAQQYQRVCYHIMVLSNVSGN